MPGSLTGPVAATGAKIRVGFPPWLRPFLGRGIAGITLGRRIYLSADVAGWRPSDRERILRHELAHVEQVIRLGLARFLVAYAGEYLRHRRAGLDHAAAYLAIGYEREAREIEVGRKLECEQPGSSDGLDI